MHCWFPLVLPQIEYWSRPLSTAIIFFRCRNSDHSILKTASQFVCGWKSNPAISALHATPLSSLSWIPIDSDPLKYLKYRFGQIQTLPSGESPSISQPRTVTLCPHNINIKTPSPTTDVTIHATSWLSGSTYRLQNSHTPRHTATFMRLENKYVTTSSNHFQKLWPVFAAKCIR